MMIRRLIGTTTRGILVRILGGIAILALLAGLWQISPRQSSSSAFAITAGLWPTYMGNNAHTGFNSTETILNANDARNLKLHWVYKAGGWISSQVIIVNGTLYWGSADGYEYASDPNGHVLWRTFLGNVPHAPPACFPTI